MWILISIAIVGVTLAVVAMTRGAEFRRRGLALIGVAVLLTLGTEALIRTDTISPGRGGEFIGIAVILLAAWAIWQLPRSGQDGRSG